MLSKLSTKKDPVSPTIAKTPPLATNSGELGADDEAPLLHLLNEHKSSIQDESSSFGYFLSAINPLSYFSSSETIEKLNTPKIETKEIKEETTIKAPLTDDHLFIIEKIKTINKIDLSEKKLLNLKIFAQKLANEIPVHTDSEELTLLTRFEALLSDIEEHSIDETSPKEIKLNNQLNILLEDKKFVEKIQIILDRLNMTTTPEEVLKKIKSPTKAKVIAKYNKIRVSLCVKNIIETRGAFSRGNIKILILLAEKIKSLKDESIFNPETNRVDMDGFFGWCHDMGLSEKTRTELRNNSSYFDRITLNKAYGTIQLGDATLVTLQERFTTNELLYAQISVGGIAAPPVFEEMDLATELEATT